VHRGRRRLDGLGAAGIVLREGEGLGGEILRTGRPLWSESYLDDAGLGHVAAVDAAARSEQLAGILGVPLQVGDDTLGVLLAADRRPRRFGHHDVELLAGLAAHAAAALRNARLFDEHRRALTALQETNAALRRTIDSRARMGRLREDLSRLVVGGAGCGRSASSSPGRSATPCTCWPRTGGRWTASCPCPRPLSRPSRPGSRSSGAPGPGARRERRRRRTAWSA
jgi:hypothetical protein